ncbi:hypothetical protein THAOC_06129, partial [Thalassiosira oceanica]
MESNSSSPGVFGLLPAADDGAPGEANSAPPLFGPPPLLFLGLLAARPGLSLADEGTLSLLPPLIRSLALSRNDDGPAPDLRCVATDTPLAGDGLRAPRTGAGSAPLLLSPGPSSAAVYRLSAKARALCISSSMRRARSTPSDPPSSPSSSVEPDGPPADDGTPPRDVGVTESAAERAPDGGPDDDGLLPPDAEEEGGGGIPVAAVHGPPRLGQGVPDHDRHLVLGQVGAGAPPAPSSGSLPGRTAAASSSAGPRTPPAGYARGGSGRAGRQAGVLVEPARRRRVRQGRRVVALVVRRVGRQVRPVSGHHWSLELALTQVQFRDPSTVTRVGHRHHSEFSLARRIASVLLGPPAPVHVVPVAVGSLVCHPSQIPADPVP